MAEAVAERVRRPSVTCSSRPAPAPASRWPTSCRPAARQARRGRHRDPGPAAPARRARPAPPGRGGRRTSPASTRRTPCSRAAPTTPACTASARACPTTRARWSSVPEGSMATKVLELRAWAEEEAEGQGHRRARRRAAPHRPRVAPGLRQRTASASARRSARSARSASPRRPRRRRSAPTWSSPTTRCWPSTPSRACPMIPDYDAVVVDEAHELVSRVTQAATDELWAAEVERAARRSQRHVEGEQADELADAAATPARRDDRDPAGSPRARRCPRSSRTRWRWCATRRAPAISAFPKESGRRRRRRRRRRSHRRPAARCRRCSPPPSGWPRPRPGRRALAGRGHRADPAPAVRGPAAVWGPMRDKLLSDKTVVITSATLMLGGDFSVVATNVGLKPAERVGDPGPRAGRSSSAPRRSCPGPASTSAPPSTTAAGDPLRRPPPAAPGSRRPGRRPARRDRRARRRRRGPHAGAVLHPPRRRGRGRGGPRAAASPDHPRPGRRAAARAGPPVRRGPAHLPLRDAEPVAGPRRPRRDLPAGADRPDPVPAPRRPADERAPEGRRQRGRQRVHAGRGHPRRPAARPGRRPADPHLHRPRRRRRPRPPPGHRPLRQLPQGQPARRCGPPPTPPWSARPSPASPPPDGRERRRCGSRAQVFACRGRSVRAPRCRWSAGLETVAARPPRPASRSTSVLSRQGRTEWPW